MNARTKLINRLFDMYRAQCAAGKLDLARCTLLLCIRIQLWPAERDLRNALPVKEA